MILSYERAVDHPRWCAAFAAAITLVFATGLPSLTVTTTPEKALNPKDPEVQFFRDFRANFPQEVSLSVLIVADDIFQIPILESIKRLSSSLSELKGISEVESLSTTRSLDSRRSEIAYRPLLHSIPTSPDQILALRRETGRNPFIRGSLVNEDGSAAAIHLLVDSRFPDRLSDKQLVDAVEALLERERELVGNAARVFQIGPIAIRVEESRNVIRDVLTLTPIAILIVLLILRVFFRSWIAVLFPVVTGILSIIATLGFMGLMNYPLTPLSSVVPTLLMVIGCTEDIHLLFEYSTGVKMGHSRRDALGQMASSCAKPILLTSLTTLLGFLVLAVNGITYLKEFAIATSFGIFINFLITISLAPVLLGAFDPPKEFSGPRWIDRIRDVFVRLFNRHRRVSVTVIILVAGIVGIGTSRITVMSDTMNYFFGKNSGIRQSYLEAREKFSGVDLIYVVVETNRARGALDPEVLDRIAQFSRDLGKHFRGIQSYPDIIRHLHGQLAEPGSTSGGQSNRELTPADVARYTGFLPSRLKDRFLDYNGSRTVLFVPTGTSNSREIERLSGIILKTAEESLGTDVQVNVTGPLVNVSRVANRLARNLVQDLAICLSAILLLVALFFRSLRLAFLFIIPNVIPLIVTFGAMGWMGTPLSLGTYPIALIVISIAVNDTIHFFARFMKNRGEFSCATDACRETLSHEFAPVFCSSLAISIGFLVLGFAESAAIRDTGYLVSIALGSALIADLIVTPGVLAIAFRSRVFSGNLLSAIPNDTGRDVI